MADIIKKVRTEYTTSGLVNGTRQVRAHGAAARRAAGDLGTMEDRLASIDRRMRRMIIGKGVRFGAGLFKDAAVGLLELGMNAQDAELSLANMLQKSSQLYGGTATSFNAALGSARALKKEFIALAKNSPIESGDVRESFMRAHTTLAGLGVGTKAQAELARSFAIADRSNKGSPVGTAANDARQLLMGQYNDRMISTPALRGAMGEAIAKAAKSGKTKKAVELLNKALTPSQEALNAWQKSTGGLWATMKDQLGQLGETAAKPLLEYASKKLAEWTEWLEKNKALAKQIALQIGRGIVGAVKTLVGLGKTIWTYWDEIKFTLGFITGVYLARMLVQMGQLVGKAIDFGKNLAAAAGIPGLGNGKLGKGVAALTGAVVGDSVGQRANQLLDTGVKTDTLGVLADLLTGGGAGGITFDTTREQAAKNAQILAEVEAHRNRKDMNENPEVKFKGGGGRKGDQKVGRMQVDKLEVRGQDLTRAMAPMTREISQAIRRERPRTSLFGLGSLSVANGSD